MSMLSRILTHIQKITGIADIAGDVFLIASAGSLFSEYPNIWLQLSGLSCLIASLIWLVWGDHADRITAPLYTFLGIGIAASGLNLFGLSSHYSTEEILTGLVATLAGLLYGYGDYWLAHCRLRWLSRLNGHLSHMLYIPAIGGIFLDAVEKHSVLYFLSALTYAIGNAGYYVVDYQQRQAIRLTAAAAE